MKANIIVASVWILAILSPFLGSGPAKNTCEKPIAAATATTDTDPIFAGALLPEVIITASRPETATVHGNTKP